MRHLTWTALVLTMAAGPAFAQPAGNTIEAAALRMAGAYNRPNAAGFASRYTEDAEIFRLGPPAPAIVHGRAEIAALYAQVFQQGAGALSITSQTIQGAFIFQKERVVRPDGAASEGLSVFEVKDGLIRRAWITP